LENVADKLNIDQQTTFQMYATIDDNIVVGLLTDNKIMGINIILNSDSKNDNPQRTLNMMMANQAISLLKTVGRFVESIKGVDTSIFEAGNNLEDFINKQTKNQKLITNYFSVLYSK